MPNDKQWGIFSEINKDGIEVFYIAPVGEKCGFGTTLNAQAAEWVLKRAEEARHEADCYTSRTRWMVDLIRAKQDVSKAEEALYDAMRAVDRIRERKPVKYT